MVKKIGMALACLVLLTPVLNGQIRVGATIGVALPHVRLEVITGKAPPSPEEMTSMQQEEAMHPEITKAMHEIEKAMHALQDEMNRNPDGAFGGHAGKAYDDLNAAWISLRKALYYRLIRDSRF